MSSLLILWAVLSALVRYPIVYLGPGLTSSPRANCDYQNFQFLLLIHLSLLNQQNWRICTPQRILPPALLLESQWRYQSLYLKHRFQKLYSRILYIASFVHFHLVSLHLIQHSPQTQCNGLGSILKCVGPQNHFSLDKDIGIIFMTQEFRAGNNFSNRMGNMHISIWSVCCQFQCLWCLWCPMQFKYYGPVLFTEHFIVFKQCTHMN